MSISLLSIVVGAGPGVSLRSLTCPSCHTKKVVQFGRHLQETMLYPVPYRQYVFSIPEILRKFFLYDRTLLGKLSQCAAKSLTQFFKLTLVSSHPKTALLSDLGVMLKILSSEVSEDSDINHMPAVKFFACLDLKQNS